MMSLRSKDDKKDFCTESTYSKSRLMWSLWARLRVIISTEW